MEDDMANGAVPNPWGGGSVTGYVPFHRINFPATQQPNALGRPTGIPNNTSGWIQPRIFDKINPHNIPVTKLIIRKQINT